MIGRRFYDLLEISEDATQKDIKDAYRRLSSRYHPDKQHGKSQDEAEENAKRFVDVKTAYECLNDPEKRVIYDESGDDSSGPKADPVEDLFMTMLNELIEDSDSIAELLAKCRHATEALISDVDVRKAEQNKLIWRLERIMKKVKYKGKGANLIEGVYADKIKNAKAGLEDLVDAGNAANGLLTLLKDYEPLDRYDGKRDSIIDPAQLLRDFTRI
jgi:hypothetical protein